MALKKETKKFDTLPEHIAIIMDGNGRWAKKRSLPRTAGHAAGSKTLKEIARHGNKIGLHYMTVYAFSTENWKRPPEEVKNIMGILRDNLKNTKSFKDENIRVKFIGDLSMLDQDLIELIKDAETTCSSATGMQLNIALNYGGRDEIVHAVKKIVGSGVKCDDITEQMISDNLYTAGIPDPDLIIRPSGEYRLSNYLIWQSSYSEFWFSDILWPDFRPKHLEEAIEDYLNRNRRYGGV